MSGSPESIRYHRGQTFALMVTVIIALLGLLPLAGWFLHVETLKRIIPGALPVKPNMAVGFLLFAIAFGLLSWRTRTQATRRWATVVAATVILLGALTLGEHFFGWNLPIEQWLIGNAPGDLGTWHPGRMASVSAFVFLLGGTVLLAEAFIVRKQLRAPLVLGLSVALVLMGGTPLAALFLEILFGPRWNFMGMNASGVVGAVGFTLLGIGLLIVLRREGQLSWSLSALTTSGFLLGVLLIAVAAGAGFDFTMHMVETSGRVTHRQEVLKEIEQVLSGVTTLASSERVYVIVGDEQLLRDRQATKAALDDKVRHLRALTIDDANQQRRLDQLEHLIAQRVDWEERVITVRRQESSAAAAGMIGTGPGLELSDKLLATIKELEAEEYRLLGGDRKRADVAVSTAFALLPMGVFLSLSILALSAFFLNGGVTEQLQAEKALRESEFQLHTIVENLDEGLVVSDLDGRLLQWNRAALKLHGYSDSDQDRRRFTELIDTFEISTLDGVLLPVEQWPLARILRDEKVHELELRLRRIGTQWERTFSYGGSLVRDANGQPLMAVITIGDITERKHAEEESHLMQTIALAIGEAKDIHGALEMVLHNVCEATGWILGQAWVPRLGGRV
ncbi:MAG TPA: CHASE3 domain-containing protein, partial [Chthoniobacterales bacterium]|nr:CHASE3 domain-containing protein [Chthoniobacterales bacterium]